MKKLTILVLVLACTFCATAQVKRAQMSYGSYEELKQGAAWLLKNASSMSKETYCSYFGLIYDLLPEYNVSLADGRNITEQEYRQYLESDYEDIVEGSTPGNLKEMGLSLNNLYIGEGEEPFGSFRKGMKFTRTRHSLSGTDNTVDIMCIEKGGEFFLFRLYKAFH